MYYATFKIKGVRSDIAAFYTERERNDWVNFKDDFSIALGMSVDNASFERIPISAGTAKKRIKSMVHKNDEFNKNQEWYVNKSVRI